MKTGKSLIELATELQRQSEAKQDFVTSTENLELQPSGELVLTKSNDALSFPTSENAHTQIAQNLKIPVKYYRRMRLEAPELLATNVNTWFADQPKRRMIRTLDGNARAYLSDRYRRLDNFQLADVVFNVLSEMGNNVEVVSSELTENRMYIKAINQGLQLDVKPGDTVQAGICISNSEVGLGSLSVEPLIYRLVCTNGMIARDFSTRKYHVGRAMDSNAFELFSDDTLKADDKAFFLKIKDTVKAAVDMAKFSLIVDQLKKSTEKPIKGNPVKTVEVLAKDSDYTEEESSGILTHLIRGGDLTAFGLSNAVTRTAQDLENYDRATHFEREGSRIITLPNSAWEKLATAT